MKKIFIVLMLLQISVVTLFAWGPSMVQGGGVSFKKYKPVADYHFDECSWSGTEGEVKDSSKNGYNLTPKAKIQTSEDGLIDRSGYFGINKNTRVVGEFKHEFKNSVTMMAWFKSSDPNGRYARIVDMRGDQSEKRWKYSSYISFSENGKIIKVHVGDSKGRGVVYRYNLDTNGYLNNEWHHIAFTYKDGTIKLYLDGKYIDKKTNKNVKNVSNPTKLYIGSTKYKGNIDEVKVFDKSISGKQIGDIYKNEKKKLNYDGSTREHLICPSLEYRFDKCDWFGVEGEVVDTIGKNSAKTVGDVNSIKAKLNQGIEFSKDSEGYIVGEPDLTLGSEPFSISFWMNPKSKPEDFKWMSVLGKEIQVFFREDGKLAINLKNKKDDLASTSIIPLNEWTHIVLAHDGDDLKLYINGKYNNKKVATDITLHGGNTLYIGKTSWEKAGYFDGSIDEFKIFDSALEKDTIRKIYENESDDNNYNGSKREDPECLFPIGCMEKALIIDDTKYVHEVDLATGEKVTYTMEKEQLNNSSINGFGYNVKDGYFWGNNQGKGGYLVRVGKDSEGKYAQDKIGPIEGLPDDKSTFIGDIDKNGHLHLLYKETDSSMHMYVVNLDKNSPEYATVIKDFKLSAEIENSEQKTIYIADIAFNPIDNQLYAIEGDDDFYKIDIEKENIKLLKKNIIDIDENEKNNDSYGTSFFDSSGFFYGLRNRSRDVIRVMFKDDENGTTVKASRFSSVKSDAQRVNIDGGRCNLAPINIDYGDAPDSYHTSLDMDGARHKMPADSKNLNLYFGEGVSSEPDAWILDKDDDDGLVGGFYPLYTTSKHFTVKLKVENNTSSKANVIGWIDFNGNGLFDKDESAKTTVQESSSGEVILIWNIADNNMTKGDTYARFRVTTDEIAEGDISESEDKNAYGVMSDGEVEDYIVTIKEGSLYDVWGSHDKDANATNPVVHTKIYGNKIALTTASLNKKRELISHTFKSVKIALFDNNGTKLTKYQDLNVSKKLNDVIFDVRDGSHKYIYAKFEYMDEANITHECNASDPFALRPDKFELIHSGSVKAGAKHNITINALSTTTSNKNYRGSSATPVKGYNELYGNSVKIKANQVKATCDYGTRKLIDSNLTSFVNGKLSGVIKYDDVGNLDINVTEVLGKEFAKIDESDGSGKDRFIKPLHTTITFIPSSFKIDLDYSNPQTAKSDYAFYSNDILKSPTWSIKVKAINSDGNVTKNYNKNCHSQDVDMDIGLDINSSDIDILDMMVKDDDLLNPLVGLAKEENSYSSLISKGDFEDGVGSKSITLNFERKDILPTNPTKLTIPYIYVKDKIDGTDHNESIDNSGVTYQYMRMYIPSLSSIEGKKEMNVNIHYETYSLSSKTEALHVKGRSTSLDMGWKEVYHDDTSTMMSVDAEDIKYNDRISVTNKDSKKLIITANNLPEKNEIVVKPTNPEFGAPRRLSLAFASNGKTWLGRGQLGNTIDNNISKSESFKRIDW